MERTLSIIKPDGVQKNVIGEVVGTKQPEQVIVVSSHHDTVPGSVGADDNASGVVFVLELARIFAKYQPKRTIRFVSYGVEERLSVENFKNCVFDQGMVSSFSAVESYEKLECLGENISSVAGIERYQALDELTISDNDLASFDVSVPMPNLTKLNANNNAIDTLLGLEFLTGLERLVVKNNSLASLSGVENLAEELKILSISANQLTSLDGIESMLNLEEIKAQNNLIEGLPSLSLHADLGILWLGGNRLENDDLSAIGDSPSLLQLILNGNENLSSLVELHRLSTLNEISLTGIGLDCAEMQSLVDAIKGQQLIVNQSEGCIF